MPLAPALIDINRLADLVGRDVTSGWLEVAQDAVTRFAQVTGDEQWIHVDPDRARAEGPYGATIAHGFLTLSLISRLMREAIRFEPAPRMAVNYGLNKVRFPAPVPAGSRVRGRFTLAHVDRPDGGGIQATWSVTVEREGSAKPCCVAEWLVRYYP
jgi:acyl dehydratase